MENLAHRRLVQEYYSKRAKDYDRQKSRTWKSTCGFGDEVTEAFLDALRGIRDKLVLEVCVGTARSSLLMAEKVRPCLVGLDFSKEMLMNAKRKTIHHKERVSFVLGDAEHLPFIDEGFSSVVCMSSMHYFTSPREEMAEASRVMRKRGVLVLGDLTLHELDVRGFLDRLEKTVSHAHGSYWKPSRIKAMLEALGFDLSNTVTVAYRKAFNSLMKDKGEYFGVQPETLQTCVQAASEDERRLYEVGGDALTLFYTVIEAVKGSKR